MHNLNILPSHLKENCCLRKKTEERILFLKDVNNLPCFTFVPQRSWWRCLDSAGRHSTSSASCGVQSVSGPTWCTMFTSTSTSCRESSSTSAPQSTQSSTAFCPRASGSASGSSSAPTWRTAAPSETRRLSPRLYWIPPPGLRPWWRTPAPSSRCCLQRGLWAWTLQSSRACVKRRPATPQRSDICFKYTNGSAEPLMFWRSLTFSSLSCHCVFGGGTPIPTFPSVVRNLWVSLVKHLLKDRL